MAAPRTARGELEEVVVEEEEEEVMKSQGAAASQCGSRGLV